MKISEFDYSLPEERIASHPVEPRDQSRLMVVCRSTGEVRHHSFSEFPDLLRPSDLVVLNNTKVFPARLLGRRLGLTSDLYSKVSMPSARVEVLLIKHLGQEIWETLVKPGRKMRIGERVLFGGGRLTCEVIDRGQLGQRKVKFFYQGDFDELVDSLGHVPLPPYISRADEHRDRADYQTIYAKKRGAVAAPTAGLHFTPEVFRKLETRGIRTAELTLHVGLGTFRQVHAEEVNEHQMEAEEFEISPDAAIKIQDAQKEGYRVIGVGTTVARTLEACALRHQGMVVAAKGETDLFIYPGFHFRSIQGLLTNFHLPRSTLLMLVCAFAGRELIFQAYDQAVREKYRFYSYGDCMLIL